jgi:hypothetical protein
MVTVDLLSEHCPSSGYKIYALYKVFLIITHSNKEQLYLTGYAEKVPEDAEHTKHRRLELQLSRTASTGRRKGAPKPQDTKKYIQSYSCVYTMVNVITRELYRITSKFTKSGLVPLFSECQPNGIIKLNP